MKYPLFCSALVICSTVSAATGDQSTRIPPAAVTQATALRDQARNDETAYRFLEALTTEIGPRLASGDNDARAREWVIAKFKALGFDKVYTEPVTYPKWVRRHESGEIVTPFPQRLVLTALGHSFGTPAGGNQR